MVVGIVGMGLIGGSLAKAYKLNEGISVYGHDISNDTLEYAMLSKIIDDKLTKDNIKECDVIFVAVYPKAAIKYIKDMAKYINKDTIVIDCCGNKRLVCDACFDIAKNNGFTFVGGHPMAGNQYSGLKHTRATMFKNASMIIVPYSCDNIEMLQKIKDIITLAGFGKITVTNASTHDEIIAYTSQLAHVVSNAFVKSPTAKKHRGFSAGSYKDLTRVAWLNEDMWTELFLENKDYLLNEVNVIIDELVKYKVALENDDANTLRNLLADGKHCKEEIDGPSARKNK